MADEDNVRTVLTRERIVRAAIELIEREGVDALSMRRVAAELGAAPMSLYYHVPNKAALLDGVAESIVAELDFADDPEVEAQDRVRALMRAFRKVAHDHPRSVTLVLTRGATAPATLRLVDHALGVARAAGMEGQAAARAVFAVMSYALGSLMTENGAAKAMRNLPPGCDLNEWLSVADPARFPNLAELAQHEIQFQPEAEFEFGMEALIAGLTALARRS